ncbi:MAG: cupredoxin domain-containing protein [Nitrospirota bacterium]
MRSRRQWAVAVAMGAVLIGLGVVSAQDGRRSIEVTIQDFAFKVQAGTLQLHEPVRIVLHNVDEVQHGFTSEALDGLEVRVESEGVVTYGRGIKGLYVDPGTEVEVLFTPNKSGPLSFRCDLHPRMKGELVVLTVGAA